MIKKYRTWLVTGAALLVIAGMAAWIYQQSREFGVIRNVAYGTMKRQKMDLYLPAWRTKHTKIIVFFHGGGWHGGSKDTSAHLGKNMAQRGYIFIIPDYRLFPRARYPQFLFDTAMAVVWVHDNITYYGGNPENIFLAGWSAGAYNAVMIALNPAYMQVYGGTPSWIRGVIGLAGPYDFLPWPDQRYKNVFAHVEHPSETQPITHVHKNAVPMLLLTGERDAVVNPSNSHSLYHKLQALDNDVTLKQYPDVGHMDIGRGFMNDETRHAEIQQDIEEFLEAH